MLGEMMQSFYFAVFAGLTSKKFFWLYLRKNTRRCRLVWFNIILEMIWNNKGDKVKVVFECDR